MIVIILAAMSLLVSVSVYLHVKKLHNNFSILYSDIIKLIKRQ